MPILLLLLLLFPGWAAWLAFGRPLSQKLATLEILFLIVLAGAVVVSWIGLLLAELGLFSLPLLALLIFGGSFLLAAFAFRRHKRLNPFGGSGLYRLNWLALPLLFVPLLLLPEPFEYIVGGRDHGIYINTGVHIARTGAILIKDADLAALSPESVPLLTYPEVSVVPALAPGPWSEGQRIAGFTIRDTTTGTILPHAFHLYPVWIALFYAVGGLRFALLATPVLAWLGTWAVYLSAVRLLGRRAAFLGLLLLVLNVSQVYFYRYPAAEILLRYLFWGGLLAFLLMLETRSRYLALVSAVALGLLHLTKLDTVFVPVGLSIYFVYAWFSYRFRPEYWYFIIPYLLLLIHTGLHALFLATIYFLDQATRVLLPAPLAERVIAAAAGYPDPAIIAGRLLQQNLDLLGAGLLLLLLLLVIARRRAWALRPLRRLERFGGWGQGVLALGVGLLALYATLVFTLVPWQPLAGSAGAFALVAMYLSPLGLLLGVVGLIQIVGAGRTAANERQAQVTFAWLLIVTSSLPLLILGSGTFPDQFWAIRRFVPILLPAFLIFDAYTIERLLPAQVGDWPTLFLPAGLALVLVLLFLQDLRPLTSVAEYDQMIDEAENLAERVPDDAVLLMERSNAAGHLALPLWLIFDRTTFTIDEANLDDPALVAEVARWRAAGREVYWINTGGATPPVVAGLDADYVETDVVAVPLLETPPTSVPNLVGLQIETFDLFRLTGDPPATAATELVTVEIPGSEQNELVAGLYDTVHWPGLSPRRWSSGRVTITVSLDTPPEAILLLAGNGRPPGVSAPVVDVSLDGQLLTTIPVNDISMLHYLPVPEAVRPGAGRVTMELEAETWVPASGGASMDNRELGIYLDWVKFVLPDHR